MPLLVVCVRVCLAGGVATSRGAREWRGVSLIVAKRKVARAARDQARRGLANHVTGLVSRAA